MPLAPILPPPTELLLSPPPRDFGAPARGSVKLPAPLPPPPPEVLRSPPRLGRIAPAGGTDRPAPLLVFATPDALVTKPPPPPASRGSLVVCHGGLGLLPASPDNPPTFLTAVPLLTSAGSGMLHLLRLAPPPAPNPPASVNVPLRRSSLAPKPFNRINVSSTSRAVSALRDASVEAR